MAGSPLALTELDCHVHLLAVTDNRQRDAVSGMRTVEQKIQVGLGGHRVSVHGDEHIAADAQLLQSRKHRACSAANSRLRRGAAGLDALDQNSLFDRKTEGFGETGP